MDADTYATIRDVVKLVGRVGAAVTPLFIIVYMGMQTLSDVEAGPPETTGDAPIGATVEDRTRAILRSDLDEAWSHYESRDYSEDMWKGIYTHVVGKWNEQAKGKGWIEFGWAPPKHEDPDQLAPMPTHQR